MANTAQAKKRSRQNIKRNEHCSAQRSRARTVVKKVQKVSCSAMSAEKIDSGVMQALLRQAAKVLDSSADKGVLHKNKAARIKSRINAMVKRACLCSAQSA